MMNQDKRSPLIQKEPSSKSHTGAFKQGGDKYVVPLFLLLLNDFAIFFSAVVLAYWVRVDLITSLYPLKPGPAPVFSQYLLLAGFNSAVGVIVLAFAGCYRNRRGITRFVGLARMATVIFISHVIVVALLSYYRAYSFSRLVIFMALGFEMFFMLGSSIVLKRVQEAMLQHGIGFFRTVLVANELVCRDLLPRLESSHGSLHHMVGVVLSDQGPLPERVLGVPVAGRLTDFAQNSDWDRMDRVIVALASDQHEQTLEIIDQCEQQNIDYRIIPDLFEMLTLRMSVGDLNGLPTITVGETPLEGPGRFLKRALDIFLSMLLLVLTAPVMAVAAVLIKFSSEGPVFYGQERVGNDGRRFTIYKLRSMRLDAESTGIGWSKEDDPRTTWIGRILRRFDIDEFPQFFNVLIGDMSMVGPRPERPYFVDQFKANVPQYMRRHIAKSGITGWAQVHGLRGDTSIEERVRYDLYYINNWSIWLDLKILFLTIFSVIKRALKIGL